MTELEAFVLSLALLLFPPFVTMLFLDVRQIFREMKDEEND